MNITHYKGYELSEFQTEAIDGILNEENVILSTHTGNGKTLVADYAVNECFKKNLKVIYTAPIKALSNQKYNQFVIEYGAENVGLVTGDRVINQDANILVATTEILRNMIHESRNRVEDIRFIILDEIHYISNEERGTVWEEVIIFKNKESKIVGLSATIPNISELCDWINSIHEEDVKKVYYPDRIVKQKHFYFDKKLGKSRFEEVVRNYEYQIENLGYVPYRNTHIDFIRFASKTNILPVLYFVFSRKQCEEKALELSNELDLINDEEKEILEGLLADYERKYPEIVKAKSWKTLKNITLKGIGYHHAGLLPIVKQFMEMLFEKRLCKVLYATETFAVGINYPVKTTCFDGLRKYDGKSFRNLMGSEYLQMAGRAGRRGLDKFGMVFVLVDYKTIEHGEFLNIENMSVEPIKSKFNLSYNTLLNLVNRYSDEEIGVFFSKSLANFQYLRSLERYKKDLETLKKQFGKSDSGVYNKNCAVKDFDSCPIIHERNRQKLKMLQVMLNHKKASDGDLKTIEKEIEELKRKVSKKCFKCSKQQKTICNDKLKELKKMEKSISRKEKNIETEIANRPEIRFKKDFDKKTEVLKALGYINENRELSLKGTACSKIHVQELFVTELLFNRFFHEEDEDTINGVVAGIVCEDNTLKDNEQFPFNYETSKLYSLMETIQKQELHAGIEISCRFIKGVSGIVESWSKGGDFFEIVEKTTMSEGGFVSLCRRVSDLLRQVKNSVPDDEKLKRKIDRCVAKIDRDIVKLGL